MIPENPDGSPCLALWANCKTPDCGNKAAWLGLYPDYCYPCNVQAQGKVATDAQYRATFGESWGTDTSSGPGQEAK